MGILTRRQGEAYVITSDREAHDAPSKRAPRWLADSYRVWTGVEWSTNRSAALNFGSLEDADEYVRANYSKVAS